MTQSHGYIFNVNYNNFIVDDECYLAREYNDHFSASYAI